MDTESFVEALNEDLKTEYQSIVQYISHLATITGAEFLSVMDELRVHLQQELSRRSNSCRTGLLSRGSPSTTVPAVDTAADSRGALVADLKLETTQLSATGRGLPKPTSWVWPMSPRRCGLFSSRPRSTCGICRPQWEEGSSSSPTAGWLWAADRCGVRDLGPAPKRWSGRRARAGPPDRRCGAQLFCIYAQRRLPLPRWLRC